jgi:hypothetical protein
LNKITSEGVGWDAIGADAGGRGERAVLGVSGISFGEGGLPGRVSLDSICFARDACCAEEVSGLGAGTDGLGTLSVSSFGVSTGVSGTMSIAVLVLLAFGGSMESVRIPIIIGGSSSFPFAFPLSFVRPSSSSSDSISTTARSSSSCMECLRSRGVAGDSERSRAEPLTGPGESFAENAKLRGPGL